ncbi:hypothetical protein LO772_05235 [Yinghuangia sp. ASG 101]|uniref:hypothetical protein n=1 Tax=Yinghuangia sp. ASG 101 TaxID=2896848 RepID=UPI001E393197|nr:hypothetical protein [Yinghuangia sp. ASG 101]UGQ13028.1 hypothetical protein LO772_05235 [Yinghuangia sp. ASG 101]
MTGTDAPDPDAPDPDGPLDDRVADFWGGGPVPLAPDAPEAPEPALDRLAPAPGAPAAIRGRNPVDLLRPAYTAMTSR